MHNLCVNQVHATRWVLIDEINLMPTQIFNSIFFSPRIHKYSGKFETMCAYQNGMSDPLQLGAHRATVHLLRKPLTDFKEIPLINWLFSGPWINTKYVHVRMHAMAIVMTVSCTCMHVAMNNEFHSHKLIVRLNDALKRVWVPGFR